MVDAINMSYNPPTSLLLALQRLAELDIVKNGIKFRVLNLANANHSLRFLF